MSDAETYRNFKKAPMLIKLAVIGVVLAVVLYDVLRKPQ